MTWWQFLLQALEGVGVAMAILAILAFLYTAYLCIRGVLPVLIRLGHGLAKRRIAIFAKGDNLHSLESLLVDAKLFRTKNIIRIANAGDVGQSQNAGLLLVYWPDWQQDIEHVLARKGDTTPLVIYAPQGEGLVPPDALAMLEEHRNVTLANFRGRLLNDIVMSLVTAAYAER